MVVKLYPPSKLNWLIHDRNGMPSAPRAMAILATVMLVGIAVYAQCRGIVNFGAFF
jgi:hypothetical protein